MISAGRGGFENFFQFKHVCFALFQVKLSGELVIAMFG